MFFKISIFIKTINQFQNQNSNYKKKIINKLTKKNREINKFTKTKHKTFTFV